PSTPTTTSVRRTAQGRGRRQGDGAGPARPQAAPAAADRAGDARLPLVRAAGTAGAAHTARSPDAGSTAHTARSSDAGSAAAATDSARPARAGDPARPRGADRWGRRTALIHLRRLSPLPQSLSSGSRPAPEFVHGRPAAFHRRGSDRRDRRQDPI